ncbi:MAG: aldehyde ferredoxin oxidoreductase family protein [Peptococcaceae bacterium]|nr:aldehyde ferredoxin oxidoreductase family protein [Peptococcaceae bacterium]
MAALKGGYTGRILRVNLTDRIVSEEELSYQTARDYIGGAGLGIRLLYDQVKPGTDPLGPDNVLIFCTGPLTGTNAPCASRMAVATRSPLTGAAGVSFSGGHFPAELKFAGFDALVIEGKAEKPVYLYIKDGQAQLHGAERLWGMLTTDTQLFLKEELGDHNTRVACIGPAGEKLSRIACIINERRAAGRRGVGAVMGSKNLKAIAVRGTSRALPIADQEAFRGAVKSMLKYMKESPALYPNFSINGTSAAMDVTMEMGILPARNFADTGVFSPAEAVGCEAQALFTIRREHCYRCPVGCSQTKIVREGEYAGVVSEGPEYETVFSLGTGVGVDYFPAIIAADKYCDEYGLDTISAGVTIAFAMELYERGLLTKDEVDGIDLKFGNHRAVMELLRKMAFREGFGDMLSDGTRLAARRIGRGSEDYALHVKGLELPAYDVRGAKAHGLNYATAFSGADHNRGYAFQEIFGVPVPEAVDRLAYEGKAKLCIWNQDVRTAVCDCPTMCCFLMDTALPAVAAQNTAALVGAASGIPLTPEDVVRVGERVNNLAKVFNVREGFTRSDDTLPRRIMEEPIRGGLSAGHKFSRQDLDKVLDQYYEARGWDKNTGIPTEGKLLELGLEEEARELARLKKI